MLCSCHSSHDRAPMMHYGSPRAWKPVIIEMRLPARSSMEAPSHGEMKLLMYLHCIHEAQSPRSSHARQLLSMSAAVDLLEVMYADPSFRSRHHHTHPSHLTSGAPNKTIHWIELPARCALKGRSFGPSTRICCGRPIQLIGLSPW